MQHGPRRQVAKYENSRHTRNQPDRDPHLAIPEFDSDTLHAAMSRRHPGTTLARVINSAVRMATTAADHSLPPEPGRAPAVKENSASLSQIKGN
jgi:hypothetical protein